MSGVDVCAGHPLLGFNDCATTGASGDYTIALRYAGNFTVRFSDPAGAYIGECHDDVAGDCSDGAGSYYGVNPGAVVTDIDAALTPAEAPQMCMGFPITVDLGAGDRPDPNAPNVIMGTKGDDVIVGGSADDVICGGAGDDRISGMGGNDWIEGQGGDDYLNGGHDDDRLVGGPGADVMLGDQGFPYLTGGDDYLDGGDGADELFGGPGDDRLGGGAGQDELWGGIGRDDLSGGPNPPGLQDYLHTGFDYPSWSLETYDPSTQQHNGAPFPSDGKTYERSHPDCWFSPF